MLSAYPLYSLPDTALTAKYMKQNQAKTAQCAVTESKKEGSGLPEALVRQQAGGKGAKKQQEEGVNLRARAKT